MKAGIVIENWKLPIFEEGLAAAGYSHVTKNGPGLGLLILHVETDEPTSLAALIGELNLKAARSRLH